MFFVLYVKNIKANGNSIHFVYIDRYKPIAFFK